MCTVSNVGDMWGRTGWPTIQPTIQPILDLRDLIPRASQEDLDKLRLEFKKELAALTVELEAIKKLLIAAKIYDAETGQPNCEQEEKIALFKRLGELCGIDFSDIFTPKAG